VGTEDTLNPHPDRQCPRYGGVSFLCFGALSPPQSTSAQLPLSISPNQPHLYCVCHCKP
jgi:hypothetical protein